MDLARMSVEELTEILENSQTAKELHAGFHSKIIIEGTESNSSSSGVSAKSTKPGSSKPTASSNFRVGVKDRARRGKK